MYRKIKAGFTLIELSIVLVIIGLIVGGVIVGREMIRQSELRSVLTDIENLKTAFTTFRLKYDCIAGDCINAESQFGTDSLGCPVGGGTGTCNGNNDAKIDWALESFRAWQQLQLAGLIKGKFTGISDETTTYGHSVVGQNVPASRIPRMGYQILYSFYTGDNNAGIWASQPPGSTQANRIIAGVQRDDAANTNNNAGWVHPDEAKYLDEKYDNQNPTTGAITTLPFAITSGGVFNPAGSCVTIGLGQSDSVYTTNNSTNCAMVFKAE